MAVLALALAFLPLVNGLVAGGIGGYVARSVKRALLAVALPVVLVGVVLWRVLEAKPAPLSGWLARLTPDVIALLTSAGLLVGALIGGYIGAGGRGRSVHRPCELP